MKKSFASAQVEKSEQFMSGGALVAVGCGAVVAMGVAAGVLSGRRVGVGVDPGVEVGVIGVGVRAPAGVGPGVSGGVATGDAVGDVAGALVVAVGVAVTTMVTIITTGVGAAGGVISGFSEAADRITVDGSGVDAADRAAVVAGTTPGGVSAVAVAAGRGRSVVGGGAFTAVGGVVSADEQAKRANSGRNNAGNTARANRECLEVGVFARMLGVVTERNALHCPGRAVCLFGLPERHIVRWVAFEHEVGAGGG